MNATPPSFRADQLLTSLTFDELEVGQTASIERKLTPTDVNLFAAMSGNVDPLHFSGGATSRFRQPIGHGMWTSSLFSGLLGTRLPGPGTIYLSQNLTFVAPLHVGDTVTATIRVADKSRTEKGHERVTFDCSCDNQNGDPVITGTAVVIPPSEHVDQAGAALPDLQWIAHDQLARLTAKCADLPPLPTAIVYPCDETSLRGACSGAAMGLVEPVLVGPQAQMQALAEQLGLDISAHRIVDAAGPIDAALKGVALAKNGEVGAVMKGALHTDELMGAIVRRDTGLRTSKRISHVFVMSVPTYPKPLLITDAVVNIAPEADDKAGIIQNAVELASVLGVETPRVAILSAVETVNPKIQSTVDAAALCKMADRGQITGAIVDGPLAFDNAISAEAARTKGIRSEVAGQPDILLVPELASGNMLVKQLSFLAHADAAGIVLGAAVPVMLTSRADSLPSRLASCALAVLLADKAARNGATRPEAAQ
ncbi:phosphotransacetylase/acyl dehydratase [Rhodobium orientis]|uniref:Enoyl-CoA hydratase n=1 Tax=Rhodobium orientis TaxID=34017 RepID=A0A327JVW2_9HYPH|nr:bifunctional enoyl-CoA hydratase/phosphate acetyltransferase [Rhodobium orientis]MBB4302668.1 phosphotransacetylase/acyl dehydratase [Rhodobium orientis]MBK5948450.1 enoyl-CoA hydratase [Rhodobium orientis]RAI29725.1 enoyl-CoA hydratase [Rhodobium orientis]